MVTQFVRLSGGFVQIRNSAAKEAGMKLRSRLVAQLISAVASVMLVSTHSAFGSEGTASEGGSDNSAALIAFGMAGLVGAGMAAIAGSLNNSSSKTKSTVKDKNNDKIDPNEDPSPNPNPDILTPILRAVSDVRFENSGQLLVEVNNLTKLATDVEIDDSKLPAGVICDHNSCEAIAGDGSCSINLTASKQAHGIGALTLNYGGKDPLVINVTVAPVALALSLVGEETNQGSGEIGSDGSIILRYSDDNNLGVANKFKFKIKNNSDFDWLEPSLSFGTAFDPSYGGFADDGTCGTGPLEADQECLFSILVYKPHPGDWARLEIGGSNLSASDKEARTIYLSGGLGVAPGNSGSLGYLEFKVKNLYDSRFTFGDATSTTTSSDLIKVNLKDFTGKLGDCALSSSCDLASLRTDLNLCRTCTRTTEGGAYDCEYVDLEVGGECSILLKVLEPETDDIGVIDDKLEVAVSGKVLDQYVTDYERTSNFTVYYEKALFAVGEFDRIGGKSYSGIAKYDGKSWQGIGGLAADASLVGLTKVNNSWYFFGSNVAVTGSSVSNSDKKVAKLVYLNNELSAAATTFGVDNGSSSKVSAMISKDGDTYLGGSYLRSVSVVLPNVTSSNYVIASSDGVGALTSSYANDFTVLLTLVTLPGPKNGKVSDYAVYQGALYVAGDILKPSAPLSFDIFDGFINTSGNIIRLSGQAWNLVDGGLACNRGDEERDKCQNKVPYLLNLASYSSDTLPRVNRLLALDEPVGSLAAGLYVAGSFGKAGGKSGESAGNLVRWDGNSNSWRSTGAGVNISGDVDAAVINDLVLMGEALYVIGSFDSVETGKPKNLAKWDGSLWSALALEAASENTGLADSSAVGSAIVVVNGKLYLAVNNGSGSYIEKWTQNNEKEWSVSKIAGEFNAKISRLSVVTSAVIKGGNNIVDG